MKNIMKPLFKNKKLYDLLDIAKTQADTINKLVDRVNELTDAVLELQKIEKNRTKIQMN